MGQCSRTTVISWTIRLNKMRIMLTSIFCLLPLTSSVKISYNTLSYNTVANSRPAYRSVLPWHVCPTFPHCALDQATGVWYSDLAASLYGNGGASHLLQKAEDSVQGSKIFRDSDKSFEKCMFAEEYCSTRDTIETHGLDVVDSTSACQQHCADNDDCQFWTFLQLRGKHSCSLLKECSAKSKCQKKSLCASGPKKCTCPALEKTGEDDKHARWNCGVSAYDMEIEVGAKCTATCGNWRNAGNEVIVVESECLLGGDWSTTKAITGQSVAYDNFYYWAKPNEEDMKCGCDTITVSDYDPNTEDGATFVCANSKDFTKEWTMTTADQCVLYCNQDLAASFVCADGGWTGEPERGFWCYSDPGVKWKIGGGVSASSADKSLI